MASDFLLTSSLNSFSFLSASDVVYELSSFKSDEAVTFLFLCARFTGPVFLSADFLVVSLRRYLIVGTIAFTEIFPCAILGFSKVMLPIPMVNISIARNAGRTLVV